MNRAPCQSCGQLVPATVEPRGRQVYLVKNCPRCGETESLISGDAERYMTKRALDGGFEHFACALNCLECRHRQRPTFVFVDVTNRCNLNCPICINNTPSMGFLFEPPMEYFERLFRGLAELTPRPPVQLFGGEPTVREDLLDIIALARSHGLAPRVVTNGLKLADPEYCRTLVATRATILIAYDGAEAATYRALRASERSLALKQRALDNLRAAGASKVALMTCVAKGVNDDQMPQLLKLCHERRDYVRGVYFMPLAHTWDPADFDFQPDRITGEDIEQAVNDCFPGTHFDFVPAGALAGMPTLMRELGIKPPPFMGAHPNCESLYVLVSDGRGYRPLDDYVRTSLHALIADLLALDQRLEERKEAQGSGGGGAGLASDRLSARTVLAVLPVLGRHIRFGSVFRGRGVLKAWHAAALLTGLISGRKTRPLLRRHTNVHEALQLIVLPFEDKHVLETDRLERCPNAFAFYDPQEGRVKTVPVCAWPRHKAGVMRTIAEHYRAASESPLTAGTQTSGR